MVFKARRMAAAALLAITVIGVVGIPAGGLRPAQAAGQTIRVGYFPNITHAQAVFGFGTGLIASELPGVTVKSTVFNAGGDEMNAMFAGAIDLGYVGPGPAINAFVKSKGAVTIIAGSATAGAELVARVGTGIKSIKDLAGKTVAVPQLGNTQDIELRALLHDAGLNSADNGGTVRIIAVDNPDTLPLFLKKSLDAALVPEPWGSRLVKEAGASIVLDANQIYGGTMPATVVVVSTSFLKAQPNLVVKFLRVHALLTRRLQENQAGILAPLNAQIKALTGAALPNDELTSALSRTHFTTHVSTADLTRFASFSVAAGYLKKGSKLNGLYDPWPLAHLLDKTIK